MTSNAKGDIQIGFVTVSGKGGDDEAQKLIHKLKIGLSQYGYATLEDRLTFDEEYLLSGYHNVTQSIDLLLAVIGDHDMSKETIRNIKAALHSYAELDLGKCLLCFTTTWMESLFAEHLEQQNYVPASICAKIDFVVGHRNFDHPQLRQMLDQENVSIAGAHLSHPGTSKKYSPSIAALVVTMDGSAMQYTGTTRLQCTTLGNERKNNSSIEDLYEMVH